jgi:ABC-2 type transport system permease protein
MNKIIAITWKITRLRFSSPLEWLFFLIMPVFFTVVLAGGTGAPSDNRIRLVVVDGAKTSLSADLIAGLGQSEAIRPDVLELKSAEDELSQKKVAAILVIPTSFDLQHLEQGQIELELRQQPNNINALATSQAVSAVARRISSAVDIARSSTAEAEKIQPFATAQARQSYFDAALKAAGTELTAVPKRIEVAKGNTKNQIEYDPRANSSAGQLITWVFIPLIGISAIFADERQSGTLRRLLTTPTRKATYLLGTITGNVILSMVQMLLLVAFGILVLKLNWGREPLALAVMMVSSALAAAALGTTLGTFVKTEGQASGLSIMTGMVMALLGGCWYPIELFPQFVRTAAKILPTSWSMQGMLDIVARGQGLAQILPIAAVLVGFAAIFFVIGIRRFRYE